MDRAAFDIEGRDLDEILERTRDVWSDLRGARLFLTGGTGFYGKWLLATILWANDRLAAGVRVCVVSRDPNAFMERFESAHNDALTFSRGDINDFDFPAGEFSHVIHAATDTNSAAHARDQSQRLLRSIVGGTERVLSFAARCGASHLLYTSSGAAYGEQPADLESMPETYTGAPLTTNVSNVHGSAKRHAELLCALAGAETGMQVTLARGFAFVGPHLPLDGHFAIGNFIRDALVSDRITVNNDRPVRSYLYAGDLAAWLITMLVRGNGIYNVGSDDALTIGELAERTAATLAPDKPVERRNADAPPSPRNRYVPNIERARRELGLDSWTPLADGLRRTATWYLATAAR